MFRTFLIILLTWCRKGWGWLLDLLYPQDCFFCQHPSGEGGSICIDCLRQLSLRRNPSCTVCGAESTLSEGTDFICSDCLKRHPAFERVFVTARYDDAIRDLVHTFKYHAGLWLRDDLVRLMVAIYIDRIAPLDLHIDLVLPIPMQRAKLRKRGYNQAAILAKAFCHELTLPYTDKLLKRVSTGIRSQTTLHRSERFQNALAAYRIAPGANLMGKTILLIDDVITTGATCDACAHLLRKAGAKKVYVLVLARPLHT